MKVIKKWDYLMEEKILDILNDINENILDYDGDNLYDDGIISSVDIVEIVSELEEAFDIEIDIDDIIAENFADKDTIIELVRRIINK